MSIALSIESPAALGSYTLLKAHIAEKMDRSDLTDQIPNFIRMAECWLADEIFHPLGETTTVLTTTAANERITLPTDLVEARAAHVVTDPIQYLEFTSPQGLREDWVTGSGSPQVMSIGNGFALIGPVPDAVYSISLTYLGSLTPLSDSNPSNWLLQRRPDLYVYASLMQAEAHIVNDERIPMWASALERGIAALNAAGNRLKRGGRPVRIRNPVCV